jgi:hypothetical protein
MPNILPSLSVVAIPFIAGLVLFFRIKKNGLISLRSFFWNYAFGFSIIGLVHLPAFFINLGVHLTYNALRVIDIISVGALFFGYMLFFRGTIFLLTKDRFITTIFPLLSLPFAAGIAIASLFILKVETIVAYTAVAWGFIFPFNFYLASLFLYFFIRGAPFDTMKRRPGALVLSLGWFFVLASHILLWVGSFTYHPELWMLRLTSLGSEHLFLAFGYLLILIGVLLCCKHLPEVKTTENE